MEHSIRKTSNRPACTVLFLIILKVILTSAPSMAQSEAATSNEEPAIKGDPCEQATQGHGEVMEPSREQREEDCKQSSVTGALPQQNREEIADEVNENTQDALTLKRLLLGRSYTFIARIEADYASYFDGILIDEDGFELRRVRAGMVGVLTDSLSYKGEFDLTDGTNNFSDVYLKWDTLKYGSFVAGNQRVAQNLSAMTGSVSQLFMERPLPVTSFSLARRLAVSQDFYLKKFGIHGVVFSKDPNNNAGKFGASVRVITNPIRNENGLAHVGFSFVREKMDRDARYSTRPESHVTDIRLVDTGNYPDIDHQNIAGLELAGAWGSTTVRSELFASRWERSESRKNDFYGAYIEIGKFLSGQKYRYADGKFIRPRIERGTMGWEVALRASWVDLNDADVRGGEQRNMAFALNWYPLPKIRAMFNLVYYDAERDRGDENGWIAQTRIQLIW